MRPTVNDIAREASVSLATVDRVLNARPGVRERTIQAVNEAIAKLGYVRDLAAANLARGRSYKMAFLLPDTESQFNQTLIAALNAASPMEANARTELLIYRFPADDAHALATKLATLPDLGVSGVAIMAPETPILRDAIRDLRDKGLAVVALISDLPNTERDHFVGIDNRAAGRTAGVLLGRFMGHGPAKVIVLSDSMLLRESIERRLGFDQVMQASFPHIEVLQTLESHGRAETLQQVLRDIMRQITGPAGIYLLGSGLRALSGALAGLHLPHRHTLVSHELTPFARDALQSGVLDAVISQNIGHVVRSALRVLRAKTDRSPIDHSQEQIRVEIVIRENLPAMQDPQTALAFG